MVCAPGVIYEKHIYITNHEWMGHPRVPTRLIWLTQRYLRDIPLQPPTNRTKLQQALHHNTLPSSTLAFPITPFSLTHSYYSSPFTYPLELHNNHPSPPTPHKTQPLERRAQHTPPNGLSLSLDTSTPLASQKDLAKYRKENKTKQGIYIMTQVQTCDDHCTSPNVQRKLKQLKLFVKSLQVCVKTCESNHLLSGEPLFGEHWEELIHFHGWQRQLLCRLSCVGDESVHAPSWDCPPLSSGQLHTVPACECQNISTRDDAGACLLHCGLCNVDDFKAV